MTDRGNQDITWDVENRPVSVTDGQNTSTFVYAGYLHARFLRGWRGAKAAVLLIVGFGAVLFTFFGNYIFSGLHSYL
jgi:ABC-type transport system involved in cytochrome c biogenesis permease subunit